MNERNILFAETLLSKFFAEQSDGNPVPVSKVMFWIKQGFPGHELRKAEIREARKRIGIHSGAVDGEYRWSWGNEKSPSDMWAQKSREIMGG